MGLFSSFRKGSSKSSLNSSIDLGLRMQPNKAYHHHQESLLSNFNGGLGLEEDCGVGGGSSTSGGGSLFSNTISNHFDSIMTNNIYDVVGAEVASVLQTSLSFASSAGKTLKSCFFSLFLFLKRCLIFVLLHWFL